MNLFRLPNKAAVIALALFACAMLLAAGAALVTTTPWRSMMVSINSAPPNGTPGSEQPGTIGLARPHPPMAVH
jgi:hypothetical protein